jgi:chemotaxis protein histidine kinase CheA
LVNNISKYVNALSDYFLTIKGRILSSQINSEGDYAHAYIQVKVPVDKFDEANLRIRNEAKEVMGQNVNSLDRTGNLVTSQTKLDELEEKRLEKEQALLVAKTENEKKRLELEIKNLNSQIKKAENEVKNVETKTDYATITLTIADNKRFFKPVNEETPDLTIVFEDAIRTVLKIIVWAVAVAIQIVVFSLLWLPLVFLIKKLLFTKKTSP